MRRCFFTFLLLFSCFSVKGQEAAKIGGTDVDNINNIGSVPISATGEIGNTTVGVYLQNCNAIKENNPAAEDGIYTIDPDGEGGNYPFECYCDMTTDGGGWTLVLLSNSSVSGCPRPYWEEVVDSVNLNGTLSGDITSFDLFLGVINWNSLGTTARLDMGASPSDLSHRAYYDFSLDEENNYALVMSNESVTIHTEGTESPGMYTYHNGRPLSTRDADHDSYSGNSCSSVFNNSAWWFGSCWSGSFWGGAGAVDYDAPYWTSSGSITGEYFDYGSIWLK